jgi:hypothetical protein
MMKSADVRCNAQTKEYLGGSQGQVALLFLPGQGKLALTPHCHHRKAGSQANTLNIVNRLLLLALHGCRLSVAPVEC